MLHVSCTPHLPRRRTTGGTVAYLSFTPKKQRIRALREEKMLTQVELAELAHLSEATIIRIEKGNRVGRSTLQALAEALEVDALELVA